jgi:hypothetical protein
MTKLKLMIKIRLLIYCVLLIAPIFVSAQDLKSPNGELEMQFDLKDGRPQYQLKYKNSTVIKPSFLGFELKGSSLKDGFEIGNIKNSSVDTTWNPVWGEESTIQNSYNELVVELVQPSDKKTLNIRFRLFNDGIGFRYEFPIQPNLKHFVVRDELTEFNLTGNHKAFWIPADYDSNEYSYTTSKLSEVDAWKDPAISFGNKETNRPDQFGVKTPLMLKSEDGLYINIHEAALIDYPVMELHLNKENFQLVAELAPDVLGNKAYLRTPFQTPWRTILVSDKAEDILASRMILNLNEPSKIEDESWIEPMKYMGVWWEMQIGKSRWDYTNNLDEVSDEGKLIPHNNHAANTKNVKRYIDFASENGIKGLLVEGWNIGWEEWLSGQEENFDFVSPYPDFDVKEITEYAEEKGVKMIMHNETGASASNYDRKMESAFKFMNKYGYNAVKTGYVGSVSPRGEHHDGQWMVKHLMRSIKTAANHKVMINIHEAVRPTGLQRTWPNFMSSEAGRGNEWNAFSTGSAPEHETILPFTRLIGGPMDYTPGIFKLKNYAPAAPQRQMHSTLAKQLALYVTIYSPLQMAADLPENYKDHMDAFQFIKDVAVDWDKTYILEAEPGNYVTIARKAKAKDEWFIGAVTDENQRTSTIKFDFLPKNRKFLATIYEDGKNADWKQNPESYTIRKVIVDSRSDLKQNLAPGGGVAISVKEATPHEIKSFKKI